MWTCGYICFFFVVLFIVYIQPSLVMFDCRVIFTARFMESRENCGKTFPAVVSNQQSDRLKITKNHMTLFNGLPPPQFNVSI